jgi:hypothetical protein
MLTGGKRLEGIVLSWVSSSVANVGLARAEESADSFSLVTGGKAGGHRTLSGCHHLLQTLVSLVQRKVPDSPLIVDNWKKLEGIVLSRVSSSVANVGLARAEGRVRTE